MEENIPNRLDKNKIKHDLIKRGEEIGLSLRKKKLEEIISAKRNIDKINENSDYQISLEELQIKDTIFNETHLEDLNNLNDPYLIKCLYYDNNIMIKFGLYFIRKYLSLYIPNSKVIYHQFTTTNIEIIDKLCELLQNSDKKIQYEASWILINLCSYFSEPVNRIIKKEKNFNNLMLFIQIQDLVLLEHGIWIINNILVDSAESFQVIMKSGINDKISDLLISKISLNFTILLVHFFKNIHKFKKDLQFLLTNKEIKPIIDIFLNSFNDYLTYDCLEYFYFVTLDFEIINIIINNDQLILKFFDLARSQINTDENNRNKTKSLEIIGNLLYGNVVQNQRLINLGVLDLLHELLDRNEVDTIKNSLFSISNITGSSSHIHLLLKKGILSKVLTIFKQILSNKSITIDKDSFNYIILKECLYCICNCFDEGDKPIKVFLLEYDLNIIDSLLFSLKIFSNNTELIVTILRTLCFAIQYENTGQLDKEYNIKKSLACNEFYDKLPQYLNSMSGEVCKYSQWLSQNLEVKEVNTINIQIDN